MLFDMKNGRPLIFNDPCEWTPKNSCFSYGLIYVYRWIVVYSLLRGMWFEYFLRDLFMGFTETIKFLKGSWCEVFGKYHPI